MLYIMVGQLEQSMGSIVGIRVVQKSYLKSVYERGRLC